MANPIDQLPAEIQFSVPLCLQYRNVTTPDSWGLFTHLFLHRSDADTCRTLLRDIDSDQYTIEEAEARPGFYLVSSQGKVV